MKNQKQNSPGFRGLVKKALESNCARHARIAGPHELLGLIGEEIRELEDVIFRREFKTDPLAIVNQLSQIAALCERGATDLAVRKR
jgi:hypothetical protein